MLMSGAEFRESLRRYRPRVRVDGAQVDSVADHPAFAPGIAALGLVYDYARREALRPLMTAEQHTSGRRVARMLHIDRSGTDLLDKLEAVRLLCQETGCAMRYLSHDAFNALYQATHRTDAALGTDYHQRFLAYLHRVQDEDLTCAVAMTDGKGDRSLRPHEQPDPDAYVRIVERRREGIVLSGWKAIVTAAPYVHEYLVMPCRSMGAADAAYAVACAVPVDAPGVTIIAKPAGRPGEKAAKFSARYGQSVGAVFFEDVLVPWERVFLAGEWEHSGFLTHAYATHHRHSCIAARAGFGDLLIGAGAMICEANGLPAGDTPHLREAMVELIKIVEGFYACGVAASVYAIADPAGSAQPEPVFANVGKLLLATQIYDMHRLAHHVSGGLVVALPGPEEDHNPASAGRLADMLAARSDVPAAHRAEIARFLGDLTASETGGWYSLISLHGGGSPEAMKREIWRNYPVGDRVRLVERLLDRGVVAEPGAGVSKGRQPGRCCAAGCQAPEAVPRAAE
jgi:4-hydroxybutyryl-CoA dehydratase/vinylacetyl-CoA-Delta-isomerase